MLVGMQCPRRRRPPPMFAGPPSVARQLRPRRSPRQSPTCPRGGPLRHHVRNASAHSDYSRSSNFAHLLHAARPRSPSWVVRVLRMGSRHRCAPPRVARMLHRTRISMSIRETKVDGSMLQLVACPQCAAPAEISDRFVLESTCGPVEHITVRCVHRHRFTITAERLSRGVDTYLERTSPAAAA